MQEVPGPAFVQSYLHDAQYFLVIAFPPFKNYLKDYKSSKIGQDKREFSVVPLVVFSRDLGVISPAMSLPPSIAGF